MTLCSAWVTEADLIACGCPDNTDPAVLELSMNTASELLYALTARQYPGTCTESLRPCSNSGSPAGFTWGSWGYPWTPMRLGGNWVNLGPCGCDMTFCGCNYYPRVNLGRNDIQTVTAVKIDGAAFTSFRLDSNQYLVRTDGSNWPCCQDLAKADTETGTWSIAATYGSTVPDYLKRAAAVLASEFIKACTGVADCRLPQRTQTITRQGMTIGLLDPFDFLNEGRTGLFEVDLAIQAANPNGLQRPGRVWTADDPTLIRS